MGNGPSLRKCDLNLLAEEVTIVSNAHFLIWDELEYVPTYLTVEDVLVAEDRADDLKGLTGIIRLFPFDLRKTLGHATESRLYVRFPRHYAGSPRFSDNLSRCAYWGGTVSFLNLQLAAYLGCNPIILIGFDHSYQVPEKRDPGYVITSTTKDVNHIHPDYFGPGFRWHDPNVERMERSYREARGYAEAQGIEILNATVGGELKTFKRVEFDSLV
jgi:hypothetical protein